MLVDALNDILDLNYSVTGCMNSEAAGLKVYYFREGRRKKGASYFSLDALFPGLLSPRSSEIKPSN